MTLRGIAAVLTLTVGAAPLARADEPPLPGALLEGSRVRLFAPSVVAGPLVGTVVAQGDDFVVVDMQEQLRVRVPRAAITSAELSTSRRRQTWKGLLIGAVVLGGVIGATGKVVEGCPTSDSSCYASREEAVMVGAIIGGVLGGYAGRRIETERWRPVVLDGIRLSVGVAPGAGAQVALSVPF